MLEQLIDYQFINKKILECVKNDDDFYRYYGYNFLNTICLKIIYEWFSYEIDGYYYLDIPYKNVNAIINKVKSKEYLEKCNNKLNQNISVLSVVGGVMFDSNNEDIVVSLIRKILYIDEIICQKNYYIMLKKWCLRRGISSLDYSYDGSEVYLTIDEYNLKFKEVDKTLYKALNKVSEEVCRYLVENKMFFKVKDVVGEYSYDNAYEKLNKLATEGYFSMPKYHQQLHDNGYEVKCSIAEFTFYFIEVKRTIEDAKRSAALGMLDLIISEGY